jgi:acetyl esterase
MATRYVASTRIKLLPKLSALILQQIAARMLRIEQELWFTTRPVAGPRRISVPTRHGAVICLVYEPHPNAPLAGGRDGRPPIHVQIHGGAFCLRLPEQDDHIDSYIASEVGAAVVNPDYSVAPQAQYPTAEEQCYDVVEWVKTHGEELGWDTSRISVGGTSAGGKLAINVVQMMHETGVAPLRAIALGCAVADVTRIYRASAKARPMVSPRMQRLVGNTYFANASRRREPLASPLFDPDLAQAMPPTLIMTGGLDTLGPEMDLLAERLADQKVEVTHRKFPDADHGFSHYKPVEVARESIELTGTYLLKHLS